MARVSQANENGFCLPADVHVTWPRINNVLGCAAGKGRLAVFAAGVVPVDNYCGLSTEMAKFDLSAGVSSSKYKSMNFCNSTKEPFRYSANSSHYTL